MRPIDADRLIETITCSCSMGGIMGKVVDAVYGYAKHMVETAPTIKLDKHTANLFQYANDMGITLEQAAKALERASAPATEGDTIYRQAIIDRLNNVIEHGVASKTTGLHPISAETVKAYVEELPPVEQRTGRWIYTEENGKDGFRCSECGFFVPWDYEYYPNSDYMKSYYNVCPRCVAKMEDDDEK